MTVCVATMFRFNYGTAEKPDYRGTAMVLMDRMISAGDVQYEPDQSKYAYITPRVVLMIAGDYSLQTQAIRRTVKQFEKEPDASPEAIATYYGRAIQALKLKEAEDIFLAPLGLNSDSFLAQQKDMAPHFVSHITEQMQSYSGPDVEALIVGGNGEYTNIYVVDTKGIVSCADDVGFAAIGSGAWHARSALMRMRFTNNQNISKSLCYSFAAKKRAEVAPGVGQTTDTLVVFKDSVQKLRPDWDDKLHELWEEFDPKLSALENEFLGLMADFMFRPQPQVTDETSTGQAGGNSQGDERAGAAVSEAPRGNEAGQDKNENGKG